MLNVCFKTFKNKNYKRPDETRENVFIELFDNFGDFYTLLFKLMYTECFVIDI